MDWTRLLDPANGGPGESPGYKETVASLRTDPPPAKRQSKSSSKTKAAHFPALKHSVSKD